MEGVHTMRKARYFKAVVAMALIAAMLCGSAMAMSLGAKVFSGYMPVYTAKSGGRAVGSLRQGTSFKVTAISGSWARISYRGGTGYAKLKDIVFNGRIPVVTTKSASIVFVTKGSLKKHTYYTATLAAGIPLYIGGIHGDNLLFFDKSGSVMGYIRGSAVRAA